MIDGRDENEVKQHWVFGPMMAAVVSLTGCGQGVEAEQQALNMRGQYLSDTPCSMVAELTADYGQRVYTFTVSADVTQEEMTLTIQEPDLLSGITAHLTEDSSSLVYDGLVLELGELDVDGLSPMEAIPALFESIRGDYMAECILNEEDATLTIHYTDPDQQQETGRETTVVFETETGAIKQGEINVDGRRVITLTCQEFHRG